MKYMRPVEQIGAYRIRKVLLFMSQLTLYSSLANLKRVEAPSGVELKTLTPQDISALGELYLVAYDSPEVAANISEAIEEMKLSFDGEYGQPLSDSFVGAWAGDKLVGAVLLVVNPPWDDLPETGPFIIDLMVLAKFRHRGIATALIGEAAYRAARAGYTNVGLRVDTEDATEAARLYAQLGFVEV